MAKAVRGQWVQIHKIILPAGERAPQVPPETRAVPLEMRVKGFLLAEEGVVGAEVTVETVTGRHVQGKLVDCRPAYDHSFGPLPAVLAGIGRELKGLVRGERGQVNG